MATRTARLGKVVRDPSLDVGRLADGCWFLSQAGADCMICAGDSSRARPCLRRPTTPLHG